MTSAVQQIEALAQRLEKAKELVWQGKVHPVKNMDNHYFVESSSGDGSGYLVNGSCNCPDAQDRSELHKGFCKHRIACEIYRENPNPELHKEESKPKARRQRRAKADGLDTPASPPLEMHGHWVPGTPTAGDDGRPLEEQIRDIT